MCCCGVCSSSAGHRFSPHVQIVIVFAPKRFVLGTYFYDLTDYAFAKDVRDSTQYQYSLACGNTFALEDCSTLRSS